LKIATQKPPKVKNVDLKNYIPQFWQLFVPFFPLQISKEFAQQDFIYGKLEEKIMRVGIWNV